MAPFPVSKTYSASGTAVTKPTGTRKNDLLLYVGVGAHGVPTGFTSLGDTHLWLAGGEMNSASVGYKIATEAEPASYNCPAVRKVISCWRGVDTTAPIGTFVTTDTSTWTVPALVTDRPNCLLLRIELAGYWCSGFNWGPTDVEAWDMHDDFDSSADCSSGGYRVEAAAGTYSSYNCVNTGGGWVTGGNAGLTMNPAASGEIRVYNVQEGL